MIIMKTYWRINRANQSDYPDSDQSVHLTQKIHYFQMTNSFDSYASFWYQTNTCTKLQGVGGLDAAIDYHFAISSFAVLSVEFIRSEKRPQNENEKQNWVKFILTIIPNYVLFWQKSSLLFF